MELIESEIELAIRGLSFHQVKEIFNPVVITKWILRVVNEEPKIIVLKSFFDAVPLGGNLNLTKRRLVRFEVTSGKEQCLNELAIRKRNLSDIQTSEDIHRVIAGRVFHLIPNDFRMVE